MPNIKKTRFLHSIFNISKLNIKQMWCGHCNTCNTTLSRIGNREWVGFGCSGRLEYEDHPLYPFPAIRYKENTNELLALKEKEKGDWRKLSIDEKKTLYRASFKQTICEVMAPTGLWKKVTGLTLLFASLGLWVFIIQKLFIYPPKPVTFTEEYRRATLRRQIDFKEQPIGGIAAHWDYEKDDWK